MAEEPVNINVVEPVPPLSITFPRKAHGGSVITTEGMPLDVAQEVDWGPIIDIAIDLGKRILGSGGGGGKPKGCTTISITNPDGSSTTITQCPPPPPP